MIKNFYFKNFKCFEEATLNVETVSILIGTNASGKTNVVEGAMILSELMTGRDISMILDGSKNHGGLIRGGSKGCSRFGGNTFTLGCRLVFDEETNLEYQIEVRVSERASVSEESLVEIKNDKKRKMMFSTMEPTDDSENIVVSCNNGKPGKNPNLMCTRYSSVISQIVTKVPTDTQYGKRIVFYAQAVISGLKDILYLNPDTHLMRNYSAVNDSSLKVDASNISSVLYKLCGDRKIKKQLLEVMRTLPENEIKDISFAEGPLSDVILFLEEKYGNHSEKIDATRLSDGTLRCLAITSSLLCTARGSMIVIEEIDNGLHPGRAKKLIQEVFRIAKERNIDVILTTHNATMLNALKKEDLAGVNVVYRSENSGDGKIISFMNIRDVPVLLASGKLGDVFTNDEILRFIKEEPEKPDYSWLGV